MLVLIALLFNRIATPQAPLPTSSLLHLSLNGPFPYRLRHVRMLRCSNEMQLNNSERQITSKEEDWLELSWFAERRGQEQAKPPDTSIPSSAPFLPIKFLSPFSSSEGTLDGHFPWILPVYFCGVPARGREEQMAPCLFPTNKMTAGYSHRSHIRGGNRLKQSEEEKKERKGRGGRRHSSGANHEWSANKDGDPFLFYFCMVQWLCGLEVHPKGMAC